MFNSLTFKYRVPYKLKPFSYCRLLNDRVRSSSVTLNRKSDSVDCLINQRPPIYFVVNQEEVEYEKIKYKFCLKCIPYIRRWKYWIPKIDNKYSHKLHCYPSYNNKYTSKLYLMTDEEIEKTKKELIFYLMDLINELHFMQHSTGIFNNYQVKRAEYLIQEQNEVKNKLKNLLGDEFYQKLMTKGEMTKYIKENYNA